MGPSNASGNAPRYNQVPTPSGNFNMPMQPGGYNVAPAPNQNVGNLPPNYNQYNQAPAMPSPEQMAVRAEQLAAPVQQSVQPAPQPAATATPQSTATAVTFSDPAVAADQDKIEKEWVDKVKDVISKTQHDPWKQQMDISRMMRDYVQKRFGKTVGKAPTYK